MNSALPSYDYPHILSGQGTIALEVLQQMDKLGVKIDAVVIPVGGGGLLAGMSTTIKHRDPHVEVIVRLCRVEFNAISWMTWEWDLAH